jgi:hypothetical protein
MENVMTDSNATLSHRPIADGGHLGLRDSASAPASAQAAAPAATPLQDPTTKYPVPPYKKQSQPWPGLAGEMDPKPDHGETSYKGSGRLAGRKALITGGDSGMAAPPPSPMPAKAPMSPSTTCPTRSPMRAR